MKPQRDIHQVCSFVLYFQSVVESYLFPDKQRYYLFKRTNVAVRPAYSQELVDYYRCVEAARGCRCTIRVCYEHSVKDGSRRIIHWQYGRGSVLNAFRFSLSHVCTISGGSHIDSNGLKHNSLLSQNLPLGNFGKAEVKASVKTMVGVMGTRTKPKRIVW